MAPLTAAALARLSHEDPAFASVYKLVPAPTVGGIVIKCMDERCLKVADPREALPPPRRPSIRVDTIEAARAWAAAHARRRHRT